MMLWLPDCSFASDGTIRQCIHGVAQSAGQLADRHAEGRLAGVGTGLCRRGGERPLALAFFKNKKDGGVPAPIAGSPP